MKMVGLLFSLACSRKSKIAESIRCLIRVRVCSHTYLMHILCFPPSANIASLDFAALVQDKLHKTLPCNAFYLYW